MAAPGCRWERTHNRDHHCRPNAARPSVYRRLDQAAYCPIVMFSSRTARPNLSRSLSRNARTFWVALGSTPCRPSAALVAGSAIAASVSFRNSPTMSAGVPFGASITVQLARSNSGTPASLKVGTSGSAEDRAGHRQRLDRAAVDRRFRHRDAAVEHVEMAADH